MHRYACGEVCIGVRMNKRENVNVRGFGAARARTCIDVSSRIVSCLRIDALARTRRIGSSFRRMLTMCFPFMELREIHNVLALKFIL